MTKVILRRNAQPIRKRSVLDTVGAYVTDKASDIRADFTKRNTFLVQNYQAGILSDAFRYKLLIEKQRVAYYRYRLFRFCYLPTAPVTEPEAAPIMISFERKMLRLILAVAIIMFGAGLFQPSLDQTGTAQATETVSFVPFEITYTDPAPTGPANWLDGKAELNGFKKDALSGPYRYAQDSGYEFASDKERLLELVEEGVLVELKENKYIKFNGVSRPYVLPVVARFVYRLGEQ